MSDGWQTSPKPVAPEIAAAADHVEALLPHVTPSRPGFTIAQHLDDRTAEALLEFARHVI